MNHMMASLVRTSGNGTGATSASELACESQMQLSPRNVAPMVLQMSDLASAYLHCHILTYRLQTAEITEK